MSRRHQRNKVRRLTPETSGHLVHRRPWTKSELESLGRFCRENVEVLAQADGAGLDAALEDLESLE